MALLVDGYNLLHVTGIFGRGSEGTALHRSRQALLSYLAAAIDDRQRAETTIVFDAAGAPPGLPRTILHEGMTVHFSRGYHDADEMIEELIELHQAPQALTVVSSDHRVQRAARRRKAKSVDSDRWFAELQSAGRARVVPPGQSSSKPMGELTPAQVAYWVKRFDKPLPCDERQRAADRWGEQRGQAEPPSMRDKDERADEKSSKFTPGDGLANPFPPGYGEDLLDELG